MDIGTTTVAMLLDNKVLYFDCTPNRCALNFRSYLSQKLFSIRCNHMPLRGQQCIKILIIGAHISSGRNEK